MTMTDRPRQAESEHTRRRIIDAAIALAGDGGMDSMSIQAVSARSGVTRGAIAFHFGTKDGLALAVVEATFDWSRAYVEARLPTGPARTIRALIDALFDLMEEPQARVLNSLIASAIHEDSPIRKPYAAHYESVRREFSDYITDAAPDLLHPETLAAVLLGATLGINLQQRLADGRLDRRAAFEALAGLFETPHSDSRR